MAASWHAVLADQAELLVGRLEDGVWAGLGLLRRGLGIDLGLEPWLRRQPPGSAGLALLVLLLLVVVPAALWALGRLLVSAFKKPGPAQAQAHGRFQHGHRGRRSGSGGGARNWDKTPADIQQQRLEEQRRKNKRKEKPKKLQPNGRAGTEPLDEEILHPFEKLIVRQHLDTEKKTEKTKKNKKKPKADMKQLQEEPQNWAEGKETDEGAWETKISSREKRQQRRRDKGINESPSVDSSLPAVGSEAVPAQQHTVASAGLGPRKTKGVETAVAPGWGEQLTVNGGSWCDIPVKLPTQINATKDDKWQQIPVLANAKRSPDQPAWGQESSDTNAGAKEWAVPLVDKTWSEHALYPSIGAWAGVNNRMNTSEQKPPFSTAGANAAVASTSSEPASQSSTTDHHWDANPAASPVDDAWSGINGIATADPSSDWNAPTEEWGNWLVEESTSAAQPEDVVAETPKLSDEDKEKVDLGLQGSATSKAKKKKKKKKKCEDAAAAPVQETEEQEKESISGDQEQFIVQDQPEKEIGPPVETICTSEPAEVEEAQMVEIAEEPAVIMESSSQDITSQVPDTLSETELPVSAAKQNNLPPSQAKSDENWESPKQIKKKKRARRET
ncbi:protein LYRIC-like isoform X1 [Stegostoma tigrinum]|uniref:protein LYRIC-like isoform X1 n=1 Tax=Stegostoma tigrinum TaxID=3053191 RepID=UPI0028709889|nr:protein LYRIC-like isoform X1 [Stegostoma tigrinum]